MSRTISKGMIINFYNEFINFYKSGDPGAVAWSTMESQLIRFRIIEGIGISNTDTVADLGCGMGHFYDYLSDVGFPSENYLGIDINSKYIISAKERNPGIDFLEGEIFDLNIPYDYIIASGVFTIAMSKGEIIDALSCAYSMCNKGVSVNFLWKGFLENTAVNCFEPEQFYQDIIKIIQPHSSKLITDYLDGEDFTIYLYK